MNAATPREEASLPLDLPSSDVMHARLTRQANPLLVFTILTMTFAVAAEVVHLIHPPHVGLPADSFRWVMAHVVGNVTSAIVVVVGVLLAQRRYAPNPRLSYGLVALLGLVAGMVRVPIENALTGTFGTRLVPWALVVESGWFVLVAWFATSVHRTAQEQREVRARLVDAVKRERATRATMLQADVALRRDVAEWVHGPVQGKLLRASLAARALGPEGAALADDLDSLRDGELRTFSHALHPSVAEIDLRHALTQLASRFARTRTVDLRIHDDVTTSEQVNRERLQAVALPIYRIVEEGLTNAVRHGHAAHLTVDLHVQPTSIVLHVHDDGRGPSGPPQAGLGSAIIDAWVQSLGGDWSLRFPVGGGADLEVTLPITPADA